MTALRRHAPPLCRAVPTWLAIFLLAILAGCATQQGPISGNQLALTKLDQWRIDGKLGFRSPAKSGSAWLRWQQRGDSYQLQLHGPFGAGATRIEGAGDYAVLSQPGEEELVAEDGEALSRQLFGWPFPVRELPHWAKGMPAPGSAADATYNELGLLTRLQQRGWQLEFRDYAEFGAWTLPTKVVGNRGDVGFTLVVKNWLPQDGSAIGDTASFGE